MLFVAVCKDSLLEARRPTIKDVAKAAGVTYPTVSRVLSGKPYVSRETRERVMHAIASLGYRPSAAARSMVLNRTHTLAMLVPNLTDPNFGLMVSGAEREARGHGYTVLVADFDTVTHSNFLSEHRMDGLLIAEAPRFQTWLASIPEVPHVAMDDVPMDNHGGARAVGEHLRGLGHARVAFLGGPEDSPHALARCAGLRDIFPNAPWFPGDWTADSGFHLAAKAIAAKVTALFAANDFVALGVLNALRIHGLEVPRDLSLVGFDDIPLARHFHPPLTTVRQPLDAQGARAAARLIARLQGRTPHVAQPQTLELLVRNSTARAITTGSGTKVSTGPPKGRHTT